MSMQSPLIVAMDFADVDACVQLAKQLDPQQCRLKIGKELFTTAGPQLVERLINMGFDIFLDLKFHDIPNTTAKAVAAAAELGVWMVNVHASGGVAMMAAAKDSLASYGEQRPLLIAVTVLTSMSAKDLSDVGLTASPADQVMRLATLSQQAGMDGVVCSAQEAKALGQTLGKDFVLVTPGIRPQGADHNDQHRIMTPQQALHAGSHYLVIGRPITQAANPTLTCQTILDGIESL